MKPAILHRANSAIAALAGALLSLTTFAQSEPLADTSAPIPEPTPSRLFLIDPLSPGAPPPIRNPTSLGAVIEYPVELNTRAIAEHPERILVPDPGRASVVVTQRKFVPLAGFLMLDDGEIIVDPRASDNDISFYWYGVGAGSELSIYTAKGVPSARFTSESHQYSIAQSEQSANGPVFRKLDSSRFPPADFGIDPAASQGAKLSVAQPDSRNKSVDFVNVFVAYTANALAAAGGLPAINSIIGQSVADTNTAFDNSYAFSVRLNLIAPPGATGAQVVYDESPGITNVIGRWFAHRTFMRTDATMQALRNTYAADIMVMLVGDTGTCGVAYTQRPNCGFQSNEPFCDVGADYETFAFSVVSTLCSVQTLTFPHEVGHQFGMEHDPPNGSAGGSASYLWSYGHTVSTPTVQARTIMSYENPAGLPANCPNGCPVFLHYSNPNVPFLAFPAAATGTFTIDGQGRYRFNARTATLLAPAMTNFRGPAVTDRIFRSSLEQLPDM